MKQLKFFLFSVIISSTGLGQTPIDLIRKNVDSLPNLSPIFDALQKADNSSDLRIKNLSPYFTIQVDSSLKYQLEINKDPSQYFFFLRNQPVGLKINKDNGLITARIDKSYFLSGRLKYNYEYKVGVCVQNLNDPTDKIDTSFTILFYSTEIIPSTLKPTVTKSLMVDEGDTVRFKIQCDNGSFPIAAITYISNYPIRSLTPITTCGSDFTWYAPYDFVKENDKDKQRKVDLYFIGTNEFHASDTAHIEMTVKQSINYPQQVLEFQTLQEDIKTYVVQLKASFRLVDKKIKKVKKTRICFDLASASTALGGTVFSSMPGSNQKTVGAILPSVGVALVPVKEAVAPGNSYDQNVATLIRSSIKRLEYLLTQNTLVGPHDPDIINKCGKLKEELKQTQIQLIDIPIAEETPDEKEVDDYFNNPEVNKKYRVKKK
ncbi:hypothetical protein [Ferruginibacter albus]|uniref:hypothetical protein n=1 Tax=Ferruginibacter albus TaxID=2875540 RepID=UPI001CC78541|nr:hypothetical protein [Ferruginibacter albus]UAY51072.1 hypothetical protein K9M53_10770 [Ferruginibacter albus]